MYTITLKKHTIHTIKYEKPWKNKQNKNFSYTGDGASHVPADMSSDQYLRADLNPNKELIARGREPTPENVKLTNGMDTVHMTIDKIESDYFNHHLSNIYFQNKVSTIN